MKNVFGSEEGPRGVFVLETGSHCIAYVDLRLTVMSLPQSFELWGYRFVPSYLTGMGCCFMSVIGDVEVRGQ